MIIKRNLIGYGNNPPNPQWPNESRIAINFVINVEEGSELSPLYGDQNSESGLSESKSEFSESNWNPKSWQHLPNQICENHNQRKL